MGESCLAVPSKRLSGWHHGILGQGETRNSSPQIALPSMVPGRFSPWLAHIDQRSWGSPQYTTSLSQLSLEYVTITHPHHPLSGQRCEVVRIRRGVDPDLIVRLRDGSHAAIAMSWTD